MRSLPLFALPVGLVVAACAKAPPPPPPPPPAEVAVLTVAPTSAEESLEFSGQVQASRTVQVRAPVNGVITERPFREGAQVRPGDVLYRIETTTYAADYRGAVARLSEAQAQYANAQGSAARLRGLVADHAVATQDVDNAETAVARARATVADARSAVDRARKSLDETVVRAEIAGRVGRALLDVGTRVTGPSDVLTTIDVVDSVYVSFRPSAEQQIRWRRDPALRGVLAPGGSARVEAVLADGTPVGARGRIGYVDPVVDPQTGTQEYRAQFAGGGGLLLPGQFVRVRLLGVRRPDAIVVPQRAVVQQMGRQSVYVVGADNKVVSRTVKATGWAGADWLIEQGLASGERVVVDGVQKIGPGAVVRPTPVAVTSPAATPTAGTPAAGTRAATTAATSTERVAAAAAPNAGENR